jgi:hypothetical protein
MATSAEPGLFSGWGTGGGRVNVRLRADGEGVAAKLQERYGDAVDLTVGFLHFPECALSHSLVFLANKAYPPPSPLLAELHVSMNEALEVKSGASLRSSIRLANDGDVEVVVQTNGRLTAPVVDPKTNETVGGYSGAQSMSLVPFLAPAGGSVEIPLLVGTASTVPRLGYAVSPGRRPSKSPSDSGLKASTKRPYSRFRSSLDGEPTVNGKESMAPSRPIGTPRSWGDEGTSNAEGRTFS